jgi:hypothetical protein
MTLDGEVPPIVENFLKSVLCLERHKPKRVSSKISTESLTLPWEGKFLSK